MQRDKLRIKKKLDWVRIAYILNEVNGLTLDKINFLLAGMFNQGKISKSNREIASIINSYQSKGFEWEQIDSKIRIYYFTGDLPEIHKRTKNRWNEKIKPLKGFVDQN